MANHSTETLAFKIWTHIIRRQQSGTGVHCREQQALNGIQKTINARIMFTNQQISNIKRQDPKSRKVKGKRGQCLIG